jgi:3-hydroxymyristoyl/3-hydroxydecanoyl-(acyl carrier protein) dehydratase
VAPSPPKTDVEILDHQEDGRGHLFWLHVPKGHRSFEGHFPGDPVMPAAAQLDVLVLPRIESLWPELGRPRSAPRLKFHRPIRPGAGVRLHLVRHASVVRFQIEDADGTYASGSLSWELRA